MVSSFIKSATMAVIMLAVVMLASTTEAHNIMTKPMPTWPNSVTSKNSPSGHIDPKMLPPPNGKAYTTEVAVYLELFWTAFNASSYKSLREFIWKVEILEKGASKECGLSVVGGTLQDLPDMIQWDFFTFGHKGPLVCYCDDTIVIQSKNAADEFPENPANVPYDKAKCTGAFILACHWLSLHEFPWQVYSNCASLKGAKPSTKPKVSTPASSPSNEPATASSPPETPTESPPETPPETPASTVKSEPSNPASSPSDTPATTPTTPPTTPIAAPPLIEASPETPPETPASTVKLEPSNPASSPSDAPASTSFDSAPSPSETPAEADPIAKEEPQTDASTKYGEEEQDEQDEQEKEKEEPITTDESNADRKDDKTEALVKPLTNDKCGVRRPLVLGSTNAHGWMSKPAVTFPNDVDRTQFIATINSSTSGLSGSFGQSPANNAAAFWTAFTASKYTSIKEFVTELGQIVANGANIECGLTDPNENPQPLPNELEWIHSDTEGFTESHHGPCEAWCDDTRVFQDTNCAAHFTTAPAKMPYDKAGCTGASHLTFYWLALHTTTWQVYVNCAAIEGSRGLDSPSTSNSTSNESMEQHNTTTSSAAGPMTTTSPPTVSFAVPTTTASPPTVSFAVPTTTASPPTVSFAVPTTNTSPPPVSVAVPTTTTSTPIATTATSTVATITPTFTAAPTAVAGSGHDGSLDITGNDQDDKDCDFLDVVGDENNEVVGKAGLVEEDCGSFDIAGGEKDRGSIDVVGSEVDESCGSSDPTGTTADESTTISEPSLNFVNVDKSYISGKVQGSYQD
ncbi:hypothetical protein DD237_000982 [Peronospora effusa]|uniref:SCP domain-containing protein n=1 Tax=Peronospora effusa TaxID=542832 RepID=A0A425C623_9STRA|nr:hypothetical protein DD237_000982 [Peronospora effusa]